MGADRGIPSFTTHFTQSCYHPHYFSLDVLHQSYIFLGEKAKPLKQIQVWVEYSSYIILPTSVYIFKSNFDSDQKAFSLSFNPSHLILVICFLQYDYCSLVCLHRFPSSLHLRRLNFIGHLFDNCYILYKPHSHLHITLHITPYFIHNFGIIGKHILVWFYFIWQAIYIHQK